MIVGQTTVLTEALAGALKNQRGIEAVVITGAVGDEASSLAPSGPDVAVLTLYPGYGGQAQSDVMADVRHLRWRYPHVRIVMLAGDVTPGLLLEAARGGVSALVPIDIALSDLIEAVRRSGDGNMILVQSILVSALSVASAGEAAQPDKLGTARRDLGLLGPSPAR